jgi:hypothetical protein
LFIKSATQNSVACFGDAAGASSGKALVYENVEIMGSLKLGSITNIATELKSKLSNTDTKLTNTAVAWSTGTVTDAYNYIVAGSAALVIKTQDDTICANLLGTGNGSLKGKTILYRGLDVLGADLLLSGNRSNVISTIINNQANGLGSATKNKFC